MAIDSFRWSGCGDFILTISIAFFYPFGLTSIVMLQLSGEFAWQYALQTQGNVV